MSGHAGRSDAEGRGDGLKAVPRAVLALIERILRPLPQISRYTLVSMLALALDFAVFLALTRSGAVGAAIAGVIGYMTGLVLHFVLSSRFVFDAAIADKSGTRLFAEFAASGVVGLVITWSVIAFAVDVVGMMPVVAKGLAVVTSFIVVYGLRRSVVFAAGRATA